MVQSKDITGYEPQLSGVDPVLCFIQGDKAFFTTRPLSEQWGDDWNDIPYEHNAGTPYTWRESYRERGIPPYDIIEIYWEGPFLRPEGYRVSNVSVEMINRGDIAWLRPDFAPDDTPPIPAGTTLTRFKQIIKAAGGAIWVKDND